MEFDCITNDEEFGNFINKVSEEIMHYATTHLMEGLMKDELSVNQYGILKVLSENGEVPMSKLAESLRVTAPAITIMVDKLESNNYVERLKDDNDRRIILVALTNKGKEVIERVRKYRKDFLNFILSKMTIEEKKKWSEIYEKIYRIIKDDVGKNAPDSKQN